MTLGSLSIWSIVETIHWLIVIYFLVAVIYFLIFAVAGLFKHRVKLIKTNKFNRIAVLIPAYKEDNVIVDTTLAALKLNYPAEKFEVIVAADQLKTDTIQHLKTSSATVIELNLSQSSKAKALTEAMKQLDENCFDIAVIFDADNHAEPDFLLKINEAYEAGYTIIQAHRTAKNTNTDFAILDAISEEVNNHLFRKAHRVLGLPAILIGSGMAFPFNLFKQLISKAKTSFEDKEIEFMLLENAYTIEYLENNMVFDEKIQNPKAFERQRTRWVYSQLYFFRKYFLKSFDAFFTKGKKGLAIRAFSSALPPRIIVLGVSFIFAIINLLTSNYLFSVIWTGMFFLSVLTIMLSTPKCFYNFRTFKALLSLPVAFFIMFKAICFSQKAKKEFLHTGHTGAN